MTITEPPRPPGTGRGQRLLIVVLTLLLAGAVALIANPQYLRRSGTAGESPTTPGSRATGKPWPHHAGRATSLQRRGLVRITTNLSYQYARAAGTGLVLRGNGLVVTNHHVVQGATSITATDVISGRRYAARLIGFDSRHDVALLRLEGAHDLPTVRTSSTQPAPGDRVTVVGDARGRLHLTASLGRVSRLDTSLTTSSLEGPSEQLSGMIETLVHVVPGDSGGATYDDFGRVIGLTTAASAVGDTGFSSPITRVLAEVRDLRRHVRSAAYTYGYPAFLGVQLRAGIGTTILEAYPGTPAFRAGLTIGDRITSIDGVRVTTFLQLRDVVRSHAPGSVVQVAWRDALGRPHQGSVQLIRGPVA